MATNTILAQRGGACVCALSLFPCRHASGVRPPPYGRRLQPTVLQSRWFYGLGRITWSAHCTTDMQMRCSGLRAPLTQSNKIGRMSWHRPWRRCISATGRRRSRPLVTVAMQHCRHVMAVATLHNHGGFPEWQWRGPPSKRHNFQ